MSTEPTTNRTEPTTDSTGTTAQDGGSTPDLRGVHTLARRTWEAGRLRSLEARREQLEGLKRRVREGGDELAGAAQQIALGVTGGVLLGVIGAVVAVVLAGLNERRRELAILRSVGARPREIFFLLMIEAVGVTVAGALVGVAALAVLTAALAPLAAARPHPGRRQDLLLRRDGPCRDGRRQALNHRRFARWPIRCR